MQEVTRAAEERMLEEELPRSIALIKTTEPDVVVFGCTSAGALDGIEHDRGIAHSIEQATGCGAVTVVESVLGQLRSVGGRHVAVFTPYESDLTNSVAECVTADGYELAKVAGMGIRDNCEIGRVSPGEIVEFVDAQMTGVEADCIFLSCTNWQALDAIESARVRFGVPVITSNQATVEAVRRVVG